jgi:cyclophilin family peptidyl-prolyl cis-trans isomerase
MKQLLLVLGLLSAIASQATLAADPPAPPPAGSGAASGSNAAAGTAAAAAAGAAKSADAAPANTMPATVLVRVVTSMGNFTIELLQERAPLTVAHFLKYVDQGYYAGTIFHRVIPNFIVQGGGFDADYKLKGNTTKVFNESGNGMTNQRGTVGFARPAEPHGGDVQFYVNLFDNATLDPNQTRWGYAVFGKIVQGMDVVDRIGNVATGAKGPFKEDAPLQPVVIERIERVNP